MPLKLCRFCPLDVVFMKTKHSRCLILHSFINEHIKPRHEQFIKLSTRENHFTCAINYRHQSKNFHLPNLPESSIFFESCQQSEFEINLYIVVKCLMVFLPPVTNFSVSVKKGRLNDQTSSMTLNFQQISDLYLMNNNIILGIKREATNAECTAVPLNKHLSICTTPKMRWKRMRTEKTTKSAE